MDIDEESVQQIEEEVQEIEVIQGNLNINIF